MDQKTYNPPLNGQKSITILRLDDVCKKKTEVEVMRRVKPKGEGITEIRGCALNFGDALIPGLYPT